ncbi:hypothetical protein [Arthrobacter rhombi]
MVKRRELMKRLARIAQTVVARHSEINEITARAILKQIEEEK